MKLTESLPSVRVTPESKRKIEKKAKKAKRKLSDYIRMRLEEEN